MRTRVVLVVLAALVVLATGCGATQKGRDAAYTFAVIGDLPYSKKDLKDMSTWVRDINHADPAFTVHVGDVKTGPADCGDDYFKKIRKNFDRFDGPLIYTPGDNDWTDCHAKEAGTFDPLERLRALRALMYPTPGTTLGDHPMKVQSSPGFPENLTFTKDSVRFVVVHLVGSDNGLLPWTDLGYDAPTAAAIAEEKARTEAAVTSIRDGFAAARTAGDRALVVLTQANLFRKDVRTDLLRPVVNELVVGANGFDGQVLLVNGDTHEYVDGDHPLASGSPWLRAYRLDTSADGITQVVTDGDKTADEGWLEFSVARTGPDPVTWKLIAYK